ncbi:MAG TPA: formate dehydrogenase accessory sulfurtransferase FdhD [Acetobacteraceae bacterium]|jgi:FdhD protein|nr:formate dehydrogenase accessory sulfurtransferase FdhD [Acetobacteraceae bacterium]
MTASDPRLTGPMPVPPAGVAATPSRWRGGAASPGARMLAEEVAVALTYNRATHAVMLASPSDLEDFAVGFSLSEAIVRDPAEIEELEVHGGPDGVEVRMWLAEAPVAALHARRRTLAGPSGCGLCGLDSLAQALRASPPVSASLRITADDITAALAALPAAQALNRETGAVHAAGLYRPGSRSRGGGLLLLREDIGRHNALDKLAGAAARAGVSAAGAMVVTTSRVSVELVQKAAVMGSPVLVAISAPTALAVRTAEAAGITLVAVARADGFEVFSHPGRIVAGIGAQIDGGRDAG